MSSKRVSGRRLVLAAGFLLASSLSAQDWTGSASVEVRVEDAKGKDVQGAEVALEYLAVEGAGGPATLLTDAHGRLAVGGLATGAWAIEVRKPGFMSYRAEIVVDVDGKPDVVAASQHNVPGAVGTMRVRLGRAKNAPPARSPVAVVNNESEKTSIREGEAKPGPPSPVPARASEVIPPVGNEPSPNTTAPGTRSMPAPAPSAPTAPPIPAPSAPVAPTPVPREQPAAAPAAPPTPAPTPAQPTKPALAPAPAPTAPAPPALAPSAPSTPTPAPVPAKPVPVAPPPPTTVPAPIPTPTPAAVAAAPVVAPTPALAPPAATPAPAPAMAAPIARSCFECRPGESAMAISATVAAGGAACPGDLAARLSAAPLGELAGTSAALPVGCSLLRVELPKGARYTGFRYEAEGPNGRAEDCLVGKGCPAGASRFVGEPIVRKEGDVTTVIGLFEATGDRRGTFTVYWSRAK